MRLAWLTDIHLNFLRAPGVQAFMMRLAETEADAFLLSGDIGEAPDVAMYLNAIANAVQRPVYFVLGNHDFYRGSIAGVREKMDSLCLGCEILLYLSHEGVMPLTEETCLIGHDGWADGRYGDFRGSDIMMNDWGLIEELGGFFQHADQRFARANALGDEAAAHFRRLLPAALRLKHVIVLTHIPPFREACWYDGKVSGDDWLPHLSCKAVGDALVEAMRTSDREMTVLCGHTHGSREVQILPNLRSLTGGARYGQPEVQRIIEVR